MVHNFVLYVTITCGLFDRCHILNDIFKFADVNETFSSRTVLCLSAAVDIFLIWTDFVCVCPTKIDCIQ